MEKTDTTATTITATEQSKQTKGTRMTQKTKDTKELLKNKMRGWPTMTISHNIQQSSQFNGLP